ncbi:MAG: hypothetical protein SF053_01870 [Bacteroidia bacterium]|nr:hypothetical protein [Bacteroidia bacterium]
MITYYNSSGQDGDINVYPFIIPFMIGALAWGWYRGLNRQKEIFDSYVLAIDRTGITREQHNTPTIHIPHAEISEIVKNTNGSFTIKGDSSVQIIGVPAQIDNADKLEKLLSEIQSVTVKSNEPFVEKYRGLLVLANVGLMVVVYLSTHKWLVGIGGTLLLLSFGYSFVEIQRSKNIDLKTKKAAWGVLPIAASVLVVMYMKLTGQS